jgi:hypothetical protein
MLALRQKDAYDNKRADLLADRGAQRVATQMVSKTAAEAASKITTTGGPITQFASVNKRGNVRGKKMLRGAGTNERTIVSQWTRSNRFTDKIDKNGKPYRVEYLVCKARGCRKQREQKVNADGSLHTNTGNLAKHYRKDHAKIHSQTSMRTVMLTASDGKVERAIEMSFDQQLRHHIDLAFAVCEDTSVLRTRNRPANGELRAEPLPWVPTVR